MSEPALAVIGSINQDLVFTVPQLPAPGETVTSRCFSTSIGGKGANQAAAAALLGAPTLMLGWVGADEAGRGARLALAAAGVDTSRIRNVSGHATGVAAVVVADDAENTIVISAGANAVATLEEVERDLAALHPGSVVLLQGELPREATVDIIGGARESNLRVILNLAPVIHLEATILGAADPLIVNEHEARALGVQPDGADALDWLTALRSSALAKSTVITLGPLGAVWTDEHSGGYMPAPPVKAVDTSGAGDNFCGVLAAGLLRGMKLPDAIGVAVRSSAISVQKVGTIASYPTSSELHELPGPNSISIA